MTQEHTYPRAARKHLSSLCGAILLVVASSSAVWADDLTISVEGFSDDLGQAVVEVFGSAETFRDGKPDAVLTARIVAREATVTLDGFEGTYALRAYHDRNLSGSLETLLPGIALEPSGYSQGVWSEVVRPDWVLVSSTSDIEPQEQLIRLRTNAFVAFAQMLTVGLPGLLAVFVGLALVRWLRGTPRPSRRTGDASHE
ncbi:DUF2141 domain-containing protein [Aliiruegeria haliotis]|nr:DUF2141 domain-containing protein [Aliiruegeria haliotis]